MVLWENTEGSPKKTMQFLRDVNRIEKKIVAKTCKNRMFLPLSFQKIINFHLKKNMGYHHHSRGYSGKMVRIGKKTRFQNNFLTLEITTKNLSGHWLTSQICPPSSMVFKDVCLDFRRIATTSAKSSKSCASPEPAKTPPTFHNTGGLIGILIMVYYNPHIIG